MTKTSSSDDVIRTYLLSICQFRFFPCGKRSKDLSGDFQEFRFYVIILFVLLVRMFSIPNISHKICGTGSHGLWFVT